MAWLKKLLSSDAIWWIAPVVVLLVIAAVAVLVMESSALLPLLYSGTGGLGAEGGVGEGRSRQAAKKPSRQEEIGRVKTISIHTPTESSIRSVFRTESTVCWGRLQNMIRIPVLFGLSASGGIGRGMEFARTLLGPPSPPAGSPAEE
jgi:hypothetical protein